MSPSSVPPQVPSSGRPLPSAGSLGAGSPTSPVLSADSDFSPPSRLASFPSLGTTTASPLFAPRGVTIPRRPGPLLPRRPRRLSSVEKTRPPRFLDNPCIHAPLSDPGGPPTPGHYRTGDGVFRIRYDVDSAMILISGLNHAACTLPVYASRPRSPQDAQHSVPAGGQPWPGRVLTCGGRTEGFCHVYPSTCLPRTASSGASSFTKLCLAHNRPTWANAYNPANCTAINAKMRLSSSNSSAQDSDHVEWTGLPNPRIFGRIEIYGSLRFLRIFRGAESIRAMSTHVPAMDQGRNR